MGKHPSNPKPAGPATPRPQTPPANPKPIAVPPTRPSRIPPPRKN